MHDRGFAQDCRVEPDAFLGSFRSQTKGRPKDQGDGYETKQSTSNIHNDPSGLTRKHGHLVFSPFSVRARTLPCPAIRQRKQFLRQALDKTERDESPRLSILLERTNTFGGLSMGYTTNFVNSYDNLRLGE